MAVCKVISMKQQMLAPCYRTINEMITELEKMSFQKFGIAMRQDNPQANQVKSKISQLKECLSIALDQIKSKLREMENQQKVLFVKKMEIEEEKKKKIAYKQEKEMKLIHYEKERTEKEAERDRISQNINSLKREIRDLAREKSGLERQVNELRSEIRSLESRISSTRDEISSNEHAKGWLIAGAVVGGLASVFTFGATVPLAVAATAGAVAVDSRIDKLNDSVRSCNSNKDNKEYRMKSIQLSIDNKEGTVRNREMNLRDKERELNNKKRKICEIQSETTLIQVQIARIEVELINKLQEISQVRNEITELANIDKLVKELIVQVTGMDNVAIALDNSSELTLSLKNIVNNLGEFERAANCLESSPEMAMCSHLEYHEMKLRLEEFAKRSALANKKGIK